MSRRRNPTLIELASSGSGSTTALIQLMTDRIVSRFNPLQVILFGSQARGDSQLQSDVDLLVVLESVVNRRDKSAEINEALRDIPLPKDVIVTTPEELSRRGALIGPLLRPALKEGKVLFERPGCRLEVGMTEEERMRETSAWLRYAQDDLSFAQDAAADPNRPARYVCFLAQQSAEKALKAVLIFDQIEYRRTHDVAELRALVPEGWKIVRDQLPDLGTLSAWAVQARYPDALREGTDGEAQAALQQAQAVWNAVSREFAARGIAP